MFEAKQILIVLAGGGCGAVARYMVSTILASRFGTQFPYGTLVVNVVGCFIMGFFMILTTERFLVSPYWRLLVTVGFLGGLTTFSSFGFETMQLLRDGNMTHAFMNIGANVFLGFLSVWLGILAAKAI